MSNPLGKPRSALLKAGSGLGTDADWRLALETALGAALGPLDGQAPDLLLLFASAAYSVRTRQERARANLLVGLAMDEYRDEFRRGDFLIRNPMGVDRDSGALAISGHVRVGQTLQFQIRDAHAADEELRLMLQSVADNAHTSPAAAVLFACNGRGVGLFGAPDHDARARIISPVTGSNSFIRPCGSARPIRLMCVRSREAGDRRS